MSSQHASAIARQPLETAHRALTTDQRSNAQPLRPLHRPQPAAYAEQLARRLRGGGFPPYADRTCDELLNRPNVDVGRYGQRANAAPYYFAQVTGVDRAFGRILAAIDETGVRDNTIVVFTADHGELLVQSRRARQEPDLVGVLRYPVPAAVSGQGAAADRRPAADAGGYHAQPARHDGVSGAGCQVSGRKYSQLLANWLPATCRQAAVPRWRDPWKGTARRDREGPAGSGRLGFQQPVARSPLLCTLRPAPSTSSPPLLRSLPAQPPRAAGRNRHASRLRPRRAWYQDAPAHAGLRRIAGWEHGRRQLFDDDADPYQVNPLPLAANKELVDRLVSELVEHCGRMGDPWRPPRRPESMPREES